ncbi:MAG: ABC transporter substrate-binding protein [Deltaproteobacteria bacterium]|jgi:iron complex transport system substrate-binding protein|nr:ABC transporter substrate-binding protein [Deltaproteobacteria bacterium]
MPRLLEKKITASKAGTLLFASIVLAFLILEAPFLNAQELMEVIDARNVLVKVPKAPERIVTLSFASTELIRLMGGISRVVGTTRYVKARPFMIPETAHIPDVGRGFMPDIETLSRLEPQLVITWAGNPGPDLELKLLPLDIYVLRLEFFLPSVFEGEVTVLSEVLGGSATERAKMYLDWINQHKKKLQDLIGNEEVDKPTVIIEHFTERRIAGPGAGAYELSQMAGANNLGYYLGRQSSETEDEWLIRQNPTVYIKIVSPPIAVSEAERQKAMEDAVREVMERPGWDEMDAVKNKRVYALDSDFSGGPRYVIGLYQMAHFFYPDKVPLQLSEDVFREYLEFQGLKMP